MEHLTQAIGHNKNSIAGTLAAISLGFIGKWTLSDFALLMGILSGAATTLYTIWKWRQDYLKTKRTKHLKNKTHEEFI